MEHPHPASTPAPPWPPGPLAFPQLLAAAAANCCCTQASLLMAAQACIAQTGLDPAALTFVLDPAHPAAALAGSGYQRLYASVAEVGQYQLDGGKSASVAQEQMDWFAGIVAAAAGAGEAVFPAAGLTDGHRSMLFDGHHRTAARMIAGATHVPVYLAQVPALPR